MSETKVNASIKSLFQAYLKQNGLRDTYERRAVADALNDCTNHFDLDQLALIITNKGGQVSRATLYNTITLLIKAQLVRRQQFDHGKILYECVNKLPSGNQLHLVCTSCGKITDVHTAAIIKDISSMKFGSFVSNYVSLTVYGLCSRCARRQRRQAQASTDQLKLFK